MKHNRYNTLIHTHLYSQITIYVKLRIGKLLTLKIKHRQNYFTKRISHIYDNNIFCAAYFLASLCLSAKYFHLKVDATKTSTWNTVMIDGVWRLVDVNSASRHVIDNDGGDWVLVDGVSREAKDVATIDASLRSDYNEFYFLTDPQNFVYSHIPGTCVIV